jgi:hypothetical protein
LLIPTEVSALIFSCASYPRLHGALDPCFVAGKSTDAMSSSSPPARTAANTSIPMPPPGSGLPASMWPDPISPCPSPPHYGVLLGIDASELFLSMVLCWCVIVAIFSLISVMYFGYFTIHILYKIYLSLWWKVLI